MKIAHVSDLHIHNLKYLKEQKQVFAQLLQQIKKNNCDIILLTGDLFHVKSNVTPEAYDMAVHLLRDLANLKPTHVILGNHDLTLSNKTRLDSVSPVVNALNHPNLFLHKDSERFDLDDLTFTVFSITDEENWEKYKEVDEQRINIALFHGSVSGSRTDVNWVMEDAELNVAFFDKFDYTLLGDIHKANQSLNDKGTIRYAGSLSQNNFGETDDKGFLVWDIKSKTDYTCEHVHIANPKPFVTLKYDELDNVAQKIPEGSRLRLVASSSISTEEVKKALSDLKKKYKPESLSYVSKAVEKDHVSFGNSSRDAALYDIRNTEVQAELIKTYLQDYKLSDESLSKINFLNENFEKQLSQNEETISRGLQWQVKKIKWDNLFNYGEGNEINFSKYKGIVGIFGKNYSGKSSIIDALLYGIFNSTSKNIRKNFNILNQNKNKAYVEVEIENNGKSYFIERTLERKKTKGKFVEDVKTNIEFYSVEDNVRTNLNGIDKTDTDKNIRKMFGTLEEFLLTSMSSQLGSMNFINEGSTKRKEIIAKFFDLEHFDKKFDLAKEESSYLKSLLRKVEDINYDELIASLESDLGKIINDKIDLEEKIGESKTNLMSHKLQIESLKSVISVPTVNVEELEKELKQTNDTIEYAKSKLSTKVEEEKSIAKEIEQLTKLCADIDIEKIKSDKKISANKRIELLEIGHKIISIQHRLDEVKKAKEIIKDIPCGTTFTDSCKFIRNAASEIEQSNGIFDTLRELTEQRDTISIILETLSDEKLGKIIDDFNSYGLKIERQKIQLEALRSNINGLKNQLVWSQEKADKIANTINESVGDKKLIEKNNEILKQIKGVEESVRQEEAKMKSLNTDRDSLLLKNGSLEQKIITLNQQKAEKQTLVEKFSLYDLYLKCMHSSGISYSLVKRNLEVINSEIDKVLSTVVDFQVYFESNDNKLDIFIKHPKYDSRPIENCSGAEKTLAAMAIRIALMNISNLSKPNLFILDEPATALDQDNMDGFIRILDLIKEYFDIVVVISHIDQLKDAADDIIEISKKDNYAFVEA